MKLYWVLRQSDGNGADTRIDRAKMEEQAARLKRITRLSRTYYVLPRKMKPNLNEMLPPDVFVEPAQFPEWPANVRPDTA
eukprot:786533-Pyramimonas_sp.AAC.1